MGEIKVLEYTRLLIVQHQFQLYGKSAEGVTRSLLGSEISTSSMEGSMSDSTDMRTQCDLTYKARDSVPRCLVHDQNTW